MASKEKVIYIELLRLISIFAVIVIHVTAVYLNTYDINTISWSVAKIFNDLSRFSVPLFFIISGACFLDLKQSISIKEMFNKYILKLLRTIVIWGTIYYFFDLWINNQVITIKHVVALPFNIISGNTGYHLWFLYDLIMIYTFVPILQIVIHRLSRRELKYLLFLFFVFECCFGMINNITDNIPAISSLININFCLSFGTGYLGCFILGYYLSHYNIARITTAKLSITAITGIVFAIVFNLQLSRSLDLNFQFLL